MRQSPERAGEVLHPQLGETGREAGIRAAQSCGPVGRAHGQKQSCRSRARHWILGLMRCWAPHNSATRKHWEPGLLPSSEASCKLNNHKASAWGNASFPSHPNGTCSPAHPKRQNTRCFPFPQQQGPLSWDHPVSSQSHSQPPAPCLPLVGTQRPRPSPQYGVQANSYLGPHKHPPQGIRVFQRALCAASAAGLALLHFNSPPALSSAGTKGQGLHPGAQSVPYRQLNPHPY